MKEMDKIIDTDDLSIETLRRVCSDMGLDPGLMNFSQGVACFRDYVNRGDFSHSETMMMGDSILKAVDNKPITIREAWESFKDGLKDMADMVKRR